MYAAAIKRIPLLKQQADDDIFVTDLCIRLRPYAAAADTFIYQARLTSYIMCVVRPWHARRSTSDAECQ